MFLEKRGRPDRLPRISNLFTKVSECNEVHWNKLKNIKFSHEDKRRKMNFRS